jgi:hypothetical protein
MWARRATTRQGRARGRHHERTITNKDGLCKLIRKINQELIQWASEHRPIAGTRTRDNRKTLLDDSYAQAGCAYNLFRGPHFCCRQASGTKPLSPVSCCSAVISDDTPPKRLVWALAIATLLVAVTVAALMYVYGVPPVITSLLDRTVTEASSEDYAAYSAFVESFFSSSQPFRADQSIGRDNVVYIVDETLLMRSPGSILPLDVAALGPSDMGEDFFRQNARTWRLEPHFHARSRLLLVGREMVQRAAWSGAKELYEEPKKGEESKWLLHASPAGPFPDDPSVSGVLQVSRIGFNRRGTLALLYYSYRCGFLCGQSGWVVLHRTDGNWRVEQFGLGVVY